MRLARLVLRHEWRRAWRDRAMSIATSMFLLLFVVATWTSREGARVRLATATAMRKSADSALTARIKAVEKADAAGNQPFIDARRLPGVRFQPVLMPGAYAFLTPGVSEWYPQHASFLALVNRWTIFDDARADLENPEVRAAGRIDPAGVVTFLLPLLLLALLHDIRTVDRDLGVDALVNAQPVRPQILLLARLAVWGLLPLLAVSLGVLVVTRGARLEVPTTFDRLPWLSAALTCAYGLFWMGVAMAVSRWSRSSGQAMVVGGALWILGVLIVPSMTALALDQFAPVPPPSTLMNAVRIASAVANDSGGSIRRSRTQQLPRTATPAERMVRMWQGSRERLGEVAAAERAVAGLADSTMQALRAREQLSARLSWLSPGSAVLRAFHHLAGTDLSRALRFQDEALRMQGEHRALFAEVIATEHLLTASDFQRIAKYRPPAVDFHPALWSAGVMTLVAMLLIGLGLRGDIRR